MTLRRADEILHALLARQPEKRIVEKTTGLPYGWGLWLRSMTPLPRPFRSSEVIAELIQRPLPGSPGRLPALGTVQAMRRLLWQTWDPAPRDQRWMRWTSGVASLLLHLLFAALLLWVALIRPPVAPEQGGDGGRIQVEFLGSGTPQDSGGGDPAEASSAAAAAAAAQAAAAQARSRATASTPAATAPQPPAPPSTSDAEPTPPPPQPTATAEPAPPTPAPTPVEQPVQATDVVEATTDFVVPPTSVPRTEVRVIPREAPEVQVRERTVEVVQAPTPTPVTPTLRPVEPQLRTPELAVREREVTTITAPTPPVPTAGPQVEIRVPQRELQVREREIAPAPSVSVTVAPVPQREITVPGRSPEVSVRERTVPNAAPRPAPATPSATASTPSATPSASPNPARQAAPSRSTASTPSTSPAPAARPAPNPGDWATPAKGDDWGAANRSRDGERSGAQANQGAGRSGDGLFNADGSVRVPGQDGSGDSERGAPGGENDGWSKERIAQSGTWLKRPPYDYTPTSFDKYWAPNESLLAEWVRKGIKAVEIPIPGTSSKISCVISILQFGGGCGLTDPNMQDQPAVARPPPDVPFKKELQEDNGSR